MGLPSLLTSTTLKGTTITITTTAYNKDGLYRTFVTDTNIDDTLSDVASSSLADETILSPSQANISFDCCVCPPSKHLNRTYTPLLMHMTTSVKHKTEKLRLTQTDSVCRKLHDRNHRSNTEAQLMTMPMTMNNTTHFSGTIQMTQWQENGK